MAQSDQTVQNATFPTVRADINDNLAALYSQSSGNSAPTTTVAFQPWVDTSSSPPVYKIRNATNSGWITIGVLDTNFEVGGITPIANGGTGETTASAAINALIPSQTGNSGKFLGTNGSAVSWLNAAGGVTVQTFYSTGTYTPTANKTTFLVIATGGGGGGGGSSSTSNAAGGGGAGGTGMIFYDSTQMGSSASVTIGGGGGGGNGNGGNGGNGGTTYFDPAGTGLTLTAYGGGGGGGENGDGGIGVGAANGFATFTGEFGCKATVTKRRTAITTLTFDNAGGGAGGMSFYGYGRGSGAHGAVWAGAQAGQAGAVLIFEW